MNKKHTVYLCLLFSFFMLFGLLWPVSSVAEDLTGKVVNIQGNHVTIELSSKWVPTVGDPVSLYLDHDDLGEMLIGQWQVTAVSYPTVEMKLVEATGEPEIGVRAVITSANPQPAETETSSQKKTVAGESKDEKSVSSAADEALLDAVVSNSLSGVKAALEKGADINRIIHPRGATVLFAAVQQAHKEIIEYLLANGADPFIEDTSGMTALVWEILDGTKTIDIINIFQEAGVSLDRPTSTGMTLLHAAAMGDCDYNTVAYLVNIGSNMNARLRTFPWIKSSEYRGAAPLMLAAINLQVIKVYLFLLAGADPDIPNLDGNTALDLLRKMKESGSSLSAMNHGKRLNDHENKEQQEIERILADPTGGIETAQAFFQMLVARTIEVRNDLESVLSLINLGVDLNSKFRGSPLLSIAVRKGSTDMVKAMLDYGADPSISLDPGADRSDSPLLAAISKGDLELVKLLLAKGADPDDLPWSMQGQGIMHEYIRSGRDNTFEMIALLLDGGADPNWRDKNGNTPLHLAAQLGYEAIFGVLLRAGAHPNSWNSDGETALDLASTHTPGYWLNIQHRNSPDSFPPNVDVLKQTSAKTKNLIAAFDQKNWHQASTVAQQLINLGDPIGYGALGYLAKEGLGGAVDLKKSVAYFKRGADLGSTDCMYSLAKSYQRGEGVAMSGKKAVEWYEKAASKGSLDAQRNLGILYLEGNGVEKNAALAYKWIKKTAIQTNTDGKAIYSLGHLCEQGIGTSADPKLAKALYEMASKKGYKQAEAALQRLSASSGQLSGGNQQENIEINLKKNTTPTAKPAAAPRREQPLEWHDTESGKVLTLGGDLFPAGQSTLKSAARHQLENTIEFLQREPDRKIRIVGHTDATGSASANQKLSEKRAKAVGDALIALGVAARRITTLGRGESFPIETNATRQGRSKNRRVEIIILNDEFTDTMGTIKESRNAQKTYVVPMHRCDELAGDPFDHQRVGPSVSWDSLDADTAVSACIEAVKMHPGVGRFKFQLARAYAKNMQTLEALKWYRKAAENDHTSAQNELGLRYEFGKGVTKDYKKAAKWYRKAAEQGFAAAQYKLGYMFKVGEGMSQDDVEALKWFRKAAEQGHARAQFYLGHIYDLGKGVPEDDHMAVKWYRIAADQGVAIAQWSLGLMYESGRGVPENYAMAAKWYRKAATQDFNWAQHYLALMYRYGKGTPQDDGKALKWFRRAAENGHADAQKFLGVIYEMGEGVPKDTSEAIKWYRKAAAQNNEEAKLALERLGVGK